MANEHVIVIDDDPDIREALQMMLGAEGFRLTMCATGDEGLAALQRERPDLILLDVMLTSPTEGFHLAYQIRADDRLREIPIIMISAIGQRTGMDFAREAGSAYLPVERFLEKPLTRDVVLTAVRDCLSTRSTAA